MQIVVRTTEPEDEKTTQPRLGPHQIFQRIQGAKQIIGGDTTIKGRTQSGKALGTDHSVNTRNLSFIRHGSGISLHHWRLDVPVEASIGFVNIQQLYWKQTDCSTFPNDKIVGQSLKAKDCGPEMITQATFPLEQSPAIFPPGFHRFSIRF